MVEASKKIQEYFDRKTKESRAFTMTYTGENKSINLLWLKDFKANNSYFDLLNHEVTHLRQFIFEKRGIKDEVEFEAYFHESIYRVLKQKLLKFIK